MKDKTFLVKKINYRIEEISKALPEEVWKVSEILDDFSSPWTNNTKSEMRFKALYNEAYLFLRYEVADDNILVYNKTGNKIDVAQSDRVEIFFRREKKLKTYYCLEVDPIGRVLDYCASFYRQFNYNWQWPEGNLFTHGNKGTNGYEIEITISIESLRNLGLIKKNMIEVGIYRGDCIKLPQFDKELAEIRWITWINPKTNEPDFHIPSSFGQLNLT